jgi:hypothetical protein
MKRCARPRWQRRDRSFMYGMRGMFSLDRRRGGSGELHDMSRLLRRSCLLGMLCRTRLSKRGATLCVAGIINPAPVLPRGGTELILTSLKLQAPCYHNFAICRASGKRQQWRRADSSIAPETCHNPGHDTTQPRLLREMDRRAGNTWGVARSARHLLRARGTHHVTMYCAQLSIRHGQQLTPSRKEFRVQQTDMMADKAIAVACGCVGALVRNQVADKLLRTEDAPRHEQMQPRDQPSISKSSSRCCDLTRCRLRV